MSGDATGCREPESAPPGFVLVEVMVAIVLLGSVIGGLVHGMQLARDAALETRGKAAALSREGQQEAGLGAWQWGIAVEDAVWESGPELVVQAGRGATSVGVWSEGWILGEWEVEACEGLRLTASTWGAVGGTEVVIRAKGEDVGWGPPWRCVVPEVPGCPSEAEAETAGEGGVELEFGGSALAVHKASSCHAEIVASWARASEIIEVAGCLLVVPSAPAGRCQVDCGGRSQSWISQGAGGLDVYF